MTISVAFALIVITATCVLVALRALGTVWPWERVAVRAERWQSLHWIPTAQAGRLHRILKEKGFYVLNMGATNGVTLLAICEVTP